MKKVLQLFVALFVVAIAFTSCKKCETCTLFDSNGVEVQMYPEQCDKDAKEGMRASMSASALAINGSYTCE